MLEALHGGRFPERLQLESILPGWPGVGDSDITAEDTGPQVEDLSPSRIDDVREGPPVSCAFDAPGKAVSLLRGSQYGHGAFTVATTCLVSNLLSSYLKACNSECHVVVRQIPKRVAYLRQMLYGIAQVGGSKSLKLLVSVDDEGALRDAGRPALVRDPASLAVVNSQKAKKVMKKLIDVRLDLLHVALPEPRHQLRSSLTLMRWSTV
jgi:hypothetical protein